MLRASVWLCVIRAECEHPDPTSLKTQTGEITDGACDRLISSGPMVYWGDRHAHTAYSLDAFGFGTQKTSQMNPSATTNGNMHAIEARITRLYALVTPREKR